MSIEEKPQPIPEGTQNTEEMIDDGQKKVSFEQELANRMGAKDFLLHCAQELNYDDRCDGRAVRAFREHLETIAKHAEELESMGYKVRVDGRPKLMGNMDVYLECGGESMEIYSQFYDTYSNGFSNLYRVSGIEKNIEIALKAAKIFRGENKEG